MSGIRQIFGKELARIFRDKKMIFSVFLLPVIIMIAILSIINVLASNMENNIESHISNVYMMNEPESFRQILENSGVKCNITAIDTDAQMEDAKAEILSGDADLIVEFPENLEQAVAGYQEGDQIPQIKTYQNPSEEYSTQAADNLTQVLETYRQTLLSQRVGDMESLVVFQVNADNDEMYIQDEEKASGRAIGMMLPYFITILLFAGAMGIGYDRRRKGKGNDGKPAGFSDQTKLYCIRKSIFPDGDFRTFFADLRGGHGSLCADDDGQLWRCGRSEYPA